ncbi:hypothetical protein H0O02_04855, partial [Candidatus Micrarchaeota archaeon]|nr:hypothetical protein [Candidatus Micrarchaeota archaeon]
TKEFSIGGKIYRFHVYKVAPGYTFGAKWADVAIFSKELKLQDGQHLDPDYDTNQDWQVAVGWKNKGAQAGVDQVTDHLRTVVIYGDDMAALSSGGDARLKENDYVPIVEDPVAWKLTYLGLDITSADRNSFKFQLERTSDYTISATKGPYDTTATATRESCVIHVPYVKVSTSKSGSVFELDGTDGDNPATLTDNTFYIGTSFGPAAGVDCGTSGFHPPGMVFMKLSPSSQYYGYAEYNWGGPTSTLVRYSTIGDGDTTWATGGLIEIGDYTGVTNPVPDIAGDGYFMRSLRDDPTNLGICVAEGGTVPTCFGVNRLTEATAANDPNWYFAVSEKAGVDTSNNIADYSLMGLYLGGGVPGDATFNWDSQDGALAYITREDYILYMYGGPVNPRGSTTTLEEGGVTERGSVFSSIDDTTVNFNMANKLAHAQYILASTGATAGAESTCVRTLAEGETSEPCNGVTVKVLSITETVGACTAGGASATCAPDMTGVSAVIMPANTATVASKVPYANAYQNQVILDRDAVGVNTVVSIGGDKVNTVTAGLLEGSAVDWTTNRKVVREVVQGSKIVVAGAEAADTLEAANDFISQLRRA